MRLLGENASGLHGLAEAARAARLGLQLHTDQQSAPAHFLDVRAGDLGQLLHKIPAQFVGALGQFLVTDDAQGGAGNGRRQRVAAKGGTMLARREQPKQGLVREHRADRIESARERLADDNHVGADILVLAGEQFPGPAETRLDFVRNQQNVVLFAQLRNFLEISLRRNDDPALALDGFDQHRGSVRSDDAPDRVRIAIRDGEKARREGAEIVAVGRLGGERDDGGGAPVEVARADDDLRLVARHALDGVRPLARQFDSRLDRLCAAVHGQGHFVAGHLGEFLVKEGQLIVAESARGERDFRGLFEHGFQNFGMDVSLINR